VDQLLYRPREAARVLGVSRSKLYELIGSGALRSVHVDGCRCVSANALREFVANLERGAA